MGSMFLCREGSCSRDRVNLGGIIFRLSTVFSLDGWLAKFLKYSTGFFQYSVLVCKFLPHLYEAGGPEDCFEGTLLRELVTGKSRHLLKLWSDHQVLSTST